MSNTIPQSGPERARYIAGVCLAFAEGKTIQCVSRGGDDWGNLWPCCPNWNWKDLDFRAKPDPVVAWIRKDHLVQHNYEPAVKYHEPRDPENWIRVEVPDHGETA